MTAATAKLLTAAMDRLGIVYSVREDYSGRGMFGQVTTGLVVNHVSHVLAAAVEAGRRLGADEEDETARDMAHDLRHIRTDNLALDIVIY